MPASRFQTTLRKFLLPLIRACRPLARWYCWWFPVKVGRYQLVVLPDTMAIFVCAMWGLFALPYGGWPYVGAYGAALLLAPLVFLNVAVVTGRKVDVVRLILLFPYWIHDVPEGADVERHEAWEDPAPTGVAFVTGDIERDPVHLGTAASAEPLYRHFQSLLEKHH